MKNIPFAVCILLLIVIHTLDMELTTQYVIDWQDETFYPMALAIQHLGKFNALWISRLVIYSFIFFVLLLKDKHWTLPLLFVITTLYWSSMVGWLFFLRILNWPSIYELWY